MKTILVFGDSLTWGYDPRNQGRPPGARTRRFADDQRWTGVMAAQLGAGYKVITEGLNGRTTAWDDPLEPLRCGLTQLSPAMDAQAPFDLVIIMLGTNDLKGRLSASAYDIAYGAGMLVERALGAVDDFIADPLVLLISPPHLGRVDEIAGGSSFAGQVAKSYELASHYEAIAAQYGVGFFDAATVATPSPIDQVHLDADQQANLGHAIAPVVVRMLS